MTAKQRLDKRHNEAIKRLRSVAMPVIEVKGLKPACKPIADKLDKSYQTVVNYVYGLAKDGFLTEEITEEFKKVI